jgi:pimeloyl-ACP methyl ester carboxylesterase
MNVFDPNPIGFPVALLIHGLGADGSAWYYQIDALKNAGLRPIAIDLPGFGKSPNHLLHWTIENVRDACFVEMQQLGIEKYTVIGHSLGGAIALSMAVEYPQTIEKLCLINSFAHLRPAKLDEWRYLLRRFIRAMMLSPKAQAEIVANRIFPEASQADFRDVVVQKIIQTDTRAYKNAMKSIALFDMRRELSRISIPCLVITSEHDNTVSKTIQQQMTRKIPTARQEIIPRGGHAVIIEQPESVNQKILNFLKNPSACDFN